MDTKNRVFSVSQIKTYLSCGLKYKFSKVDRLDPLPTERHHLWLGSLVHSSIYAGLGKSTSSKTIELYKKPSLKKALHMFETLWESNLDAADEATTDVIKSLGERPTGKFLTGKINSLKSTNQDELELAWKLVARNYVENGVKLVEKMLKSDYKIVEIEKQLNFELLGRKFVGYIDILFEYKPTKELLFIDFKTNWDKPSEVDVMVDLQFLIYSQALMNIYNLTYQPNGALIHLKSGEPVKFTAMDKSFELMFKTLKNVFENMESDIFFDNYGHPFCKNCEFRYVCYGEDAV